MSDPLPAGGEALLRHLVSVVKSQQAELEHLRLEVATLNMNVKKFHSDVTSGVRELSESTNEQCTVLRRDILKVTETVRAIELSGLEAEQLAAAKMRALESQSMQQIDINAQRVADAAHLQERFNALLALNKTSLSPQSSVADDGTSSVGSGELGLRLKRLQQQFDDLLAVFEIPNTYTTSGGRPMTTQSIEVVAAQPRAKRVKFLHSLPCFHVLWAELFRLQQQRQVPYVSSPPASARRAVELSESPARAVVESSRFHPAGIVAIPGLGVDVIAMEGQKGVVIHRVVLAGALAAAGCVEGDTIVAVGAVSVMGCFHFADLIEEAQRVRSNRLMLSVIPSGRSIAMPLDIRVAFQ
jgi:hypothetical protein